MPTYMFWDFCLMTLESFLEIGVFPCKSFGGVLVCWVINCQKYPDFCGAAGVENQTLAIMSMKKRQCRDIGNRSFQTQSRKNVNFFRSIAKT